jgi:hypothetical protein
MGEDTEELGRESGIVAFIRDLAAERRWVMSGTPIVDNMSVERRDKSKKRAKTIKAARKDICEHIHYLIAFLRHETYSNRSAWKKDIENAFLSFNEGRCNVEDLHLFHLLKSVMVRHTKKDLNLPPPQRSDWWLPSMPDVIFPVPSGQYDKDLASYNVESTRNEAGLTVKSAHFAGRIMEVVCKAREQWRQGVGDDRRPVKAIVFAESVDFLHEVGHYFVTHLHGRNHAVAEHWGNMRNTELSRFRNNLRSYKFCHICHRENELSCRNLQRGL